MMHAKISLSLVLTVLFSVHSNDRVGLNVYDYVPGLDPSPYYSVKVREGGSTEWDCDIE